MNGQLVYRKAVHHKAEQIDLASFEKGIYFVKVQSGGTSIAGKIIKF
jgi:hypothetical protein